MRMPTPLYKVIGVFNDPPPLPTKINLAHKRRIRQKKMRKVYLTDGNAIDDAERERLTLAGKEQYIGKKDPTLERKLMEHSVAWLLWQMEGAHYYLNHGNTIPSPESMEKKLKKQFVDDDYTPAKFLLQRYDVLPHDEDHDGGSHIELQALFDEYKKHDGAGRINRSLDAAQFSKAIQKAATATGAKLATKRGQGKGGKATFFLNLRAKGR